MDAGISGSNPEAVLVDMDGTLCDVRSIRHFVERQSGEVRTNRRDFHAFHSASLECPAHQPVVNLLDALRGIGLKIVIVSAREARWGFMTAIWLREHDIAYDDMFLRDNGDYRRDEEVKADIAKRLVRRYTPVLAIDDQPDIIRVWHSWSIPTARVLADGSLEKDVGPAGMQMSDFVQKLKGRTDP